MEGEENVVSVAIEKVLTTKESFVTFDHVSGDALIDETLHLSFASSAFDDFPIPKHKSRGFGGS